MSFIRFRFLLFSRYLSSCVFFFSSSFYSRSFAEFAKSQSVGLGISIRIATNLMVYCLRHNRWLTIWCEFRFFFFFFIFAVFCCVLLLFCFIHTQHTSMCLFMHFYCSDFNAAKWLLLLLFLQSIPSIVKSHVNVSVMKQLYLPTYAYISVRRNYNDLWFRVMMTWYILKWYKVIFETRKKNIWRKHQTHEHTDKFTKSATHSVIFIANGDRFYKCTWNDEIDSTNQHNVYANDSTSWIILNKLDDAMCAIAFERIHKRYYEASDERRSTAITEPHNEIKLHSLGPPMNFYMQPSSVFWTRIRIRYIWI